MFFNFINYCFCKICFMQNPSKTKIEINNAVAVIIPKYNFTSIESSDSQVWDLENNFYGELINRKRYFIILSSIGSIKFVHKKKIGKIYEYPFDIERGIEIIIVSKTHKMYILRDHCTYIDFSAQFSCRVICGVLITLLFKYK